MENVKEPDTTAVHQDTCAHCWHESTSLYSYYCCKCGKYIFPNENHDHPNDMASDGTGNED